MNIFKYDFMAILAVCLRFCIHIRVCEVYVYVCVCACVCSYCITFLSNKVYILFVAYILFNKHLKKILQEILHTHHIGVCIYGCPVAPTTKLSLIGNNCCPVVRPVSSSGRRYGRQLREGCSVLSRRRPVCF